MSKNNVKGARLFNEYVTSQQLARMTAWAAERNLLIMVVMTMCDLWVKTGTGFSCQTEGVAEFQNSVTAINLFSLFLRRDMLCGRDFNVNQSSSSTMSAALN